MPDDATIGGPTDGQPDERDVATPARGVPAAPADVHQPEPVVPPVAPYVHQPEPVAPPVAPYVHRPDAAAAEVLPLVPGADAGAASRPDLRLLASPALAAAAAYVAALAVSLVAVAFTLLIPDGDGGGSAAGGSADATSTFGVLVRLPFLVVSAALFGSTKASVDAGFGGGGATLFLVPLTVTVAALAGAWLLTALRGPLASVRERWRHALLTGVVLGVGGALVAALASVSWSASSELLQADASLGVNAWGTLLGGFAVGVLGSALGHAFSRHGVGLARIGLGVPAPWTRSLRVLTLGAVPVSLVGLVVGGLVAVVKLGFPETVALALTFAPTALAYGFTLGGLGGLTGSSGGSTETATLFSGGSGWFVLLVLLPVLTVVVAGVAGRLEGARRDWRDSWYTPAVAAALALVALFLTQLSLTLGGSGVLGGSGIGISLRLAWWTVPLAAAWGFLVEVFERLAAPYVLTLVPGLTDAYGRVARVVPVAGASAFEGATGLAGDAAGPAGAAPAPAQPARNPIDPRRAKLVLAVVGGVVVLVVGAAIARSVVGNALYSPDKPVEAYLDELESGDVEGAFALADPDVSNADRGLLTNDVYGAVEARPTDAKVTDVEVNGDRAVVTVSAKQDGRTVTQTFDVVKNGRAGLVFDKWELEAPDVPKVDVYGLLPYDADGYTVNGKPIEGGDGFVALPGRYTIALPVDDDHAGLVESGEATVTVYPDGSTDVEADDALGYTLTSDATGAVDDDAARIVADSCLGQDSLDIDSCNLRVYEWRADEAKNITWTPKGEPTVETELTDEGTIVAHVSGEAAVSYDLPKAEYYPAESPSSDEDYDFWLTYQPRGGELGQGTVSPYRY